MSYDVKWDDDEFVICRLHGAVDGEEVCKAVDETAHLVRSHGEVVNVCSDWRDIEMLAVSPSELMEIVRRMNEFAKRHPYGRTAIVATRAMYRITAELLVVKAYLHARDRRAFASMDEAREWVLEPSPSNA